MKAKKPGGSPLGKPGGMGGGAGAGGNMGGLMAQVQKMQKDMADAQAALENENVEVSVGGGALTIVISGHQRIQSIKINPDVVDTSDSEWVIDLQDLLVAAVNQAIEQSQTMAAERMEKITGGLGSMPGLGGMFG